MFASARREAQRPDLQGCANVAGASTPKADPRWLHQVSRHLGQLRSGELAREASEGSSHAYSCGATYLNGTHNPLCGQRSTLAKCVMCPAKAKDHDHLSVGSMGVLCAEQ